MNSLSCPCESVDSSKIFSLNAYVPYEPGYGHTFNGLNTVGEAGCLRAVGMAGPDMGVPVARPYNSGPLPIGSTQPSPYYRGEGDMNPYYNLPTFNAYSVTGDPATFNPLSNYALTGDPATFNPVSGYPSISDPVGITPVGEAMPAMVGSPYRVGGEGIGGKVEPLGSWYEDAPYSDYGYGL